MQEATSLEVLRLWDLPTARPTDALRMNKMGLGAVKNRKAVEFLRARKLPKGAQEEDLPLCEVNAVGMRLSHSTFEHLMANERVTVKAHEGEGCDDDDDFMQAMMNTDDIERLMNACPNDYERKHLARFIAERMQG